MGILPYECCRNQCKVHAKTGYNVDQVFMTIAKDFVTHNKNSSRELNNTQFLHCCVTVLYITSTLKIPKKREYRDGIKSKETRLGWEAHNVCKHV